MNAGIRNWIHVHPDETALFSRAVALMFLIRCSGLIFNNFTETVFLKRFGVEFLPFFYILNPFITLIVMGNMSRLSPRISAFKRLQAVLFGGAVIIVFLWSIVPFSGDMIYAALFILKVQLEALLSILFWNLCNELFNFHQSKRIFPIITAGGVIGGMGGNLLTLALSRVVAINHFMLVYAMVLLVTLSVARNMARRFPVQVITPANRPPQKKQKKNPFRFLKSNPLSGSKALITVVVVLAFLSNAVLPIMNYQFNVAVDQNMVGEETLIFFFGMFRGIMDVVSLLLLAFTSRIYGKWSLPVSMLFHPVNYFLVFISFLFRFDIFSALYARFSTNILRTVFNQPSNNILIGLFPDAYRSRIRPFLRGVVARGGLITGSGLILLFKDLVPAAHLSMIALPFAGCWIGTVIYLKLKYPALIVQLLTDHTPDLESTGLKVRGKLFQDPVIRHQLLNRFSLARGEDAIQQAQLLKYLKVENLDSHILDILPSQDPETMTRLMSYLSSSGSEKTFKVFKELIDVQNKPLTLSMIRAARPLEEKGCRDFFKTLKARCKKESVSSMIWAEVQALSTACVTFKFPEVNRQIIQRWLRAPDEKRILAGLILAGESKEPSHIPSINQILTSKKDSWLISSALSALKQLNAGDINHSALAFLNHPSDSVRISALDAIELNNDKMLESVFEMTADALPVVRSKAIEKIKACSHCNSRVLFKFIHHPARAARQAVFTILKIRDISKPDLYAFIESELHQAETCFSQATDLENVKNSLSADLLKQHLGQKTRNHVQTIIRVLSIKDASGQMRIIARHVFSLDPRKQGNAVEALENTIHPTLSKRLIPLVFQTGKKAGKGSIRKKGAAKPPLESLLSSSDLLTRRLTLALANEIEALSEQDSGSFSLTPFSEAAMEKKLSIQEKILLIQKVDIFKTLDINDLSAISGIAEETSIASGKVLFREKSIADTMYICIDGRLATYRNGVAIGHFKSQDSFGLSAFLADNKRFLTCVSEEETRLLEIHKHEFEQMLMEFPQVSFEIARAQARMIERLLVQIKKGAAQESLLENFFNKSIQ